MSARSCGCISMIACLAVIGVLVGLEILVDAQGTCMTQTLTNGVCVPVSNCQTIAELTRTQSSASDLTTSTVPLAQQSQCGIFNGTQYVCCETQSVTDRQELLRVSAEITLPKFRPSVELTSADIDNGMNILNNTRSCGISVSNRVSAGDDTILSQYPWMTQLVYENSNGERSRNCGGSLITNRYVLTAAHCVRTGYKKLVSVLLADHDGTQDLNCKRRGRINKCDPYLLDIDIEYAIYHKDFKANEFANDIALIRLSESLNFHSDLKPICLPITQQSKEARIYQLIISGWGKTESGVKAEFLQGAQVRKIDNELCQIAHRGITITDKQICAGGTDEVSTCSGDSGGPLFCWAPFGKGARNVQFGIVSAGSFKCGASYPGIYVNVVSYIPWIAANLKN